MERDWIDVLRGLSGPLWDSRHANRAVPGWRLIGYIPNRGITRSLGRIIWARDVGSRSTRICDGQRYGRFWGNGRWYHLPLYCGMGKTRTRRGGSRSTYTSRESALVAQKSEDGDFRGVRGADQEGIYMYSLVFQGLLPVLLPPARRVLKYFVSSRQYHIFVWLRVFLAMVHPYDVVNRAPH